MNISDRILEIIEKRNLTKTEFASRLNVTQPYISKIVNKGAVPSDRLIEDICEKFNVNEEWLRTGKGEMRKEMPELDEIAIYVEELLGSEDNPFFDMIIAMMKSYHELDDSSKRVMLEFFRNAKKNLENKRGV